ncbi:hypothetical protein SAMN02745126_05940 [Enhydrobacter aerosaccus]|uniref:Uncharacterized protein n=1 Tax=Enhydrobacter aerosaccus TaxID=225324 RepID=A0A1T4TBB2_9HYPH|nr:hypothetical protein [Enhydrobacter aerosaccus]SKA37687.1 hypothetical protein SAMN02745126_05940 [Enhydrobacter aerosaccus]
MDHRSSTSAASPSFSGATSSEVKADIDRGLAGDKVATPDPGLAAFGTDEEAAGTPTPADAFAAMRSEQRRIGRDAGPVRAPTNPAAVRSRGTLAGLLRWTGLAIAALIVAAIVLMAAGFPPFR